MNGIDAGMRDRRYAELVVRLGANVQPGQVVLINAFVEQAVFARALAEAAYAAGARYVDVWYWDPVVKRSRLRHAPRDTLTTGPGWLDQRYRDAAEASCALIRIDGDPNPRLFDDVDPSLVALDPMPVNAVSRHIQHAMLGQWCICAYPTPGWAQAVFGEPDTERLWAALATAVRLDQPDPIVAWRRHLDGLAERARALDAFELDAVHFHGGGTDLTVGLLPQSRWLAATGRTQAGVECVVNLPTEEVFTTPDRRRTEGTVRSTRPLLTHDGAFVEGLVVTFRAGKAVAVDATRGADAVRTQMSRDKGGPQLGEVALVTAESAVARAGITFQTTLLDENASAHVAYGSGYPQAVRGADPGRVDELYEQGVNLSAVHTDFMIGSPEVSVDGIRRDATVVELIRADAWVI